LALYIMLRGLPSLDVLERMFFLLSLMAVVTVKHDGWPSLPVFKLPSRTGILEASDAGCLCQVGAVFGVSGARVGRAFWRAIGVDSGAHALAPIARTRRAPRTHNRTHKRAANCAYAARLIISRWGPGGGCRLMKGVAPS